MQAAAGGDPRAWKAEQRRQCVLLRDLFGDPFEKVSLNPAFVGPGVVAAVARTIYEQGRFGDLPVLADALEDAGCADEAVLTHLRGPGPHARGCWCLDLILGRG